MPGAVRAERWYRRLLSFEREEPCSEILVGVVALNRSTLRIALLSVGSALLVLGGLATSQYRKATAFGPLFADPFSLAVDAAGNLYCGVEFERVHKYSPEGRMIGAWSVDAALRPFRLRAAADTTIEVATSDGKLIRFDDSGKTISSRDDPGAFARFGPSNDREVRAASGIRYAVSSGAIVRSENGSTAVWLRAPAWPLRWIRAPVALAVLLVLGPVGMLASVVVRRSPREAEECHGTPR